MTAQRRMPWTRWMQRTPWVGWAGGLSALLLAACASEPPVALRLIDARSAVHRGSFDPTRQTIEVVIAADAAAGEVRYTGFYVLATGTGMNSMPPLWFPRRGLPLDMTTIVRTNMARAALTAADGRHLACDFTIDGRRAVGECASPDGTRYQLVADGS